MNQTKDDLREKRSRVKKLKIYFSKIIRFNVVSWKIALSLALGVFIGLLLPMGFQAVLVIPLALLLKCNIFITMSATLVSNPFTVVPLYYIYFKIGEFLTSVEITEAQLNALAGSPSFENIQSLGENALILFFSGSIPVSIIFGIATYAFSLMLVNYYRKKRGIVIN